MRRSAGEIAAFLDDRARSMRKFPTPAEALLWDALEPLGFEFQSEFVGRTKNGGRWFYILDFARYPHTTDEATICVEVDGSSHRKRKGRDRRRDARLKAEGVATLRFRNQDVLKNIGYVLATIQRTMAGEVVEVRL
jgi:very-short-patch-repair endonuclease